MPRCILRLEYFTGNVVIQGRDSSGHGVTKRSALHGRQSGKCQEVGKGIYSGVLVKEDIELLIRNYFARSLQVLWQHDCRICILGNRSCRAVLWL